MSDPIASDEPWPKEYSRPNPYSEHTYIQQLEDALDASNNKLGRIEMILRDRTLFNEDIVGKIADLFDDY